MPRSPRLHAPGGFYHVILRGNHREALFGCPADRDALNQIVSEAIDRYGVRIHAFCWMTNHLHALIQISAQPLGKVMHRIAVRYSRYRHKILRTTGHLFERRHKASLVDVDAYFLTLVRYIHANPVKAHMVADPLDYPWSSHRAYLGRDTIPWLTTNFGLSLFSNDLATAQAAYARFTRCSVSLDDEDLDTAAHPLDRRVLGGDSFIASIPSAPFKPRSLRTLEELAHSVCTEHGISVELLRSPSRARSLSAARIALVTTAIEQRIATCSEVARFLHRGPTALSKLLARHAGKRPPP